MSLLNLAPPIQEALLLLPRTVAGRDPITEHHLRSIAQVIDWERQQKMFTKLMES